MSCNLCALPDLCPQALEAARKQLQKREAELAEATAESEAAAGEREQIKEQLAASEATIQGEHTYLSLPLCKPPS